MRNREKIEAFDRTRAEALLDRGYSYKRVARIFGVSDWYVAKSLPGKQRRVLVRLSEPQLDTAARMLDDGCSYSEVARTIGCAPGAIRYRFPGRGWSTGQTSEFNASVKRLRPTLDGWPSDDHRCTDCKAGLHDKCDGTAWCIERDETVECRCYALDRRKHGYRGGAA